VSRRFSDLERPTTTTTTTAVATLMPATPTAASGNRDIAGYDYNSSTFKPLRPATVFRCFFLHNSKNPSPAEKSKRWRPLSLSHWIRKKEINASCFF
jgi:hypothetical protein